MNNKITTYFQKPYEIRFYDIIVLSLIIIISFRIILLFEISKIMHGINITNLETILTIFSIIGILIAFFTSVKEQSSSKMNDFIFLALIFHVFFSMLDLTKFLLPNNPLTLPSEDVLLILLQLFSVSIIFGIYLFNNFQITLNNSWLFLFVISLFTYFFSKFLEKTPDISILLLFITNFIFLGVIWFFIIKYTKILIKNNHKLLISIAILTGIFLGIGITMGMTKKEVLTAVISLILDKFFGLFVINGSIPILNFNPEFLMILANSISGFVFIITMLISYIKIKDKKERLEISSYILIGFSGLSMQPVFGIFRIIALKFFLRNHHKDY